MSSGGGSIVITKLILVIFLGGFVMGLRVEINNDFGVGKNNNMSADTKK